MNAQTQAKIAELKKAAADAFQVYDRAFRNLAANDTECNKLYAAWQKAQDAWQQAKFDADKSAYDFAVTLGTAGFMKEPKRTDYR